MRRKADPSRATAALLAALVLMLSACSSSADKAEARNGERRGLGSALLGTAEPEAPPRAAAAASTPAPAPVRAEPVAVTPPPPAVLAALLTDELATRLTRADQIALERTAQTTLESVPIGTESRWNNPESGHAGTITPTRTYQRPSGQYCREFTQVVIVGGRSEEAKGTACREPDGTWRKVAA